MMWRCIPATSSHFFTVGPARASAEADEVCAAGRASSVHRVCTGVKPGQHLRDLVREAGGLTPSAYVYGAQFSRESVRVEQRKRLDQMIAETERA